jgi:RNA-binding protein
MALSSSQIRYLRSLAHDLSAVVLLGNKGATEAVVKELNQALDIHELVKIKLSGGDKEERQAQIDVLTGGTGARQAFPAAAFMAGFLRRNIGIEVMDNAAAARTYNLLADEGRRVVAAFILPPG